MGRDEDLTQHTNHKALQNTTHHRESDGTAPTDNSRAHKQDLAKKDLGVCFGSREHGLREVSRNYASTCV